MAARFRVRRIAKWAGLLASIGMVVLWGLTLRYQWLYMREGATFSGLNRGIVLHERLVGPPEEIAAYVMQARVFWRGWRFYDSPVWRSPLSISSFGLVLPTASSKRLPRPYTHSLRQGFSLPIWVPFVMFAIPTAFLWYRDRRRRVLPGHCQRCGYDLTKNESGRCPECGVPTFETGVLSSHQRS